MAVTLWEPIVFGDASTELGDHASAAAQTLSSPGSAPGTLVGDALALSDHALGGNDALFGGGVVTTVIGDAIAIGGHARGGNDHASAGAREATVLGDAVTISGHARAGDDNLEAHANGTATVFGDAQTITGHAYAGNDLVSGTSSFGDVQLYGDAQTLSSNAVGGNDTLIAAAVIPVSVTHMYGDSAELLDNSRGGDDRLISGIGTDLMWGDAAVVGPHAKTGADTFGFSLHNGHDTIMDFEPGKDHIQLEGFGFESFSDLESHIQNTADGALITFDQGNSILVIGVNNLTAGDFIFA